jgi:hypothetical protein
VPPLVRDLKAAAGRSPRGCTSGRRCCGR